MSNPYYYKPATMTYLSLLWALPATLWLVNSRRQEVTGSLYEQCKGKSGTGRQGKLGYDIGFLPAVDFMNYVWRKYNNNITFIIIVMIIAIYKIFLCAIFHYKMMSLFFNLVYNLTLYVFFFKQHTKLNDNSLIKLKYIWVLLKSNANSRRQNRQTVYGHTWQLRLTYSSSAILW